VEKANLFDCWAYPFAVGRILIQWDEFWVWRPIYPRGKRGGLFHSNLLQDGCISELEGRVPIHIS